MNKDKYSIFNFILILLPIIDLLSGITTRLTDYSLTIGAITKGLMIIYFVIYIFFLTNAKNKKQVRWLTAIIIIYCLLYFVTKPQLLSGYLLTEASYLMKIIYFPILFLGLTCYYSDKGFDKDNTNKVMLISQIIYIIFLLIPLLTDTYFNTYEYGGEGSVGWYYSGNEISGTCVLLLPFIYTLLKDKYIVFIFAFLITAFTISMIGTKVAMLGTIIVCILISIYALINYKKIKFKTFILSILALISMILIMYDSPAIRNMNALIIEPPVSEEPAEEIIGLEPDTFLGKNKDKLLKLLSGRDIYLISVHNIHIKNRNAKVIMFGLGFSNTPNINNKNITKLIEIDILDIYYHTGICGLLVILLPFIYTLIILIKSLIAKQAFNTKILFYGFMVLLALGISCFSGHILFSPAVSLYIAFYLIFLLNEIHYFNKLPLKENKIEILSLHLGFGGAERSTIDLANMLSEKYEVELISLYKTVDKIPYKVSSNVKITYLTDKKPNREEFKEAVKNVNIIKIFKEGFKSIYILYLKYVLIKNKIEYSDAETIISSRIYFTNILNNHGRNETKKIAVEHNYNVDETYIKKLKRSCTNINALVVVSKTASNIYKEKLDIDVVHIPNIVADDYNGTSKLDNKKLIFVGRLEEEKGVMDLIEVMNKLHEYDKDITLDIFGDGTLKTSLENKIDNYKLNKIIQLHGFKTPQELCKAYQDSSLFILVSHKESFGIVLLEAMKCGVPAIAFDEATGAKENIANGKNGYLIKDRDIDKMKDTILKYLSLSKKEKQIIQKNAIAHANKYSQDIIKKDWNKLIKKINQKHD